MTGHPLPSRGAGDRSDATHGVWFDGHLDLAYLAVNGRDMHAEPESAGGPDLPAAVTVPSLQAARVRATLGTIFTERDGPASSLSSYPAGDAPAARTAGLRQLDWYQRASPASPRRAGLWLGATRVLILMENADPIAGPGDVDFWRARGLAAVGLTWARSSRYAGGNSTDEPLSPAGRDLVHQLDAHGVAHDVSHLSDRSFWQVFDAAKGRVIASHSNCRTLMGGGLMGQNQRHLHDEQIRAIVSRGGVIGLNLYSAFLRTGLERSGRASVDDAVAHIEHVCSLAGSAAHVALGSDMDGGFSAQRLPDGIDRPADLHRLCDALAQRGWSEMDLAGFRYGNWARVFAPELAATTGNTHSG